MSMISPITKIDGMHFRKIPGGRGVPCKKIAIVEGMVAAVLADGSFWTNWEALRNYCLMPGEYWGRADRFLRCLTALGFITRKQRAEHMEYAARATKASELRSDQKDLDSLAKKYGFKTPKLKPPTTAGRAR